MKITEFRSLISELPYRKHAFTIKRENWKCNEDASLIIDRIFANDHEITLNRYDLINSNFHLPDFILKTLMWGYPTKGRGTNIDKLLKPDNFKNLVSRLEPYTGNNVTLENLKIDIQSLEGMGLSTMSKLITFLDSRINGMKTAILDQRIIDVINLGKFEELDNLKIIRNDNAVQKYGSYIEVMNKLANELQVEIDQVEMFLFIFGKSLSDLKGENCYDFD